MTLDELLKAATPRPWEVSSGQVYEGGSNTNLALFQSNRYVNAELTARAVNAIEQARDALQEAWHALPCNCETGFCSCAVAKVSAALAAIEGRS